MLLQLKIQNLVLIKEMDLSFCPGFNAITGETGSGKSLIVTAIELLTGIRGKNEMVRKGAQAAEIEGLFNISDEPPVKKKLENAGIPVDNELFLRRTILKNGRNKIYINGRLASLGLLADISYGLSSIMGQREHHVLLDPSSQLALIDEFGKLKNELGKMSNLYDKRKNIFNKLEELKTKSKDVMGRLDYLKFQHEEIKKLNPIPGEKDKMLAEIKKLRHVTKLDELTKESTWQLYDSDNSVFDKLSQATSEFENAVKYDDKLAEPAGYLSEAAALVEEATRYLQAYSQDLEPDPDKLNMLEERRYELTRIEKKHGLDLAQIVKLKAKLEEEINKLANYDDSVMELENNLNTIDKQVLNFAAKLSEHRLKASLNLKKAVTAQLKDLAFKSASFKIELAKPDGMPGPKGIDSASFLVSINPGEGTHPIRKAASGGELSRLMLALKCALTGVGPVGTYVFDEVDSGIGGKTASVVGKKLYELGKSHQVICVTHLPQICSQAQLHVKVEKKVSKNRTTIHACQLDSKMRINETARMLAGEKITKKSLATAREMLNA